MFHEAGTNDIVLFVALGYTGFDIFLEWDNFSKCAAPVHKWLFTSCLCTICFRLARLLATYGSSASQDAPGAAGGRAIGGQMGEYLLDIGHKGWLPNAISKFTWWALVPFFALWNILGTKWLWQVLKETPQCVPTDTYVWFSALWLLLTYIWLVVHAALAVKAWKLKCLVQRAEANLSQVEDPETLARWGRISDATGMRNLVDASSGIGLSPAAIKALPCEVASAACPRECSICLVDIDPGEHFRCLPRCGHAFHRSCIDLWLVRQADCPLCKQSVDPTMKR